jgi:hypothetical protein|nr:hypothetical protein [uncultured Pseudomonas sp.]
MKGDRLRSPVKLDYIEALGRATYTFASLEWQVVWCAEKIQPSSIRKIVDKEMTAGTIANFFVNVVRNMPKIPEREELAILAARFMELVKVRNNIIHGKPCTGPNGESRLSGNKVIEIPDLEQAADDFVECGGKLNSLYYGFLKTYEPTKGT